MSTSSSRPKKKATESQMINLRKGMFKKGQVGNPLGGGAHNPITKALRHLTQKDYAEVINLALNSNTEGLREVINDPKTTAIKLGVAKCLLNAINFSDDTVFNRIIERLVGKPAERIEIKTETDLSHLSDEDLIAIRNILTKNTKPANE